MSEKSLPWLALPVGRFYEIMKYLAQTPPESDLTERDARVALSLLTCRKEKTTENYVRSLRYLRLVEIVEGKITVSSAGTRIVEAGVPGWKQALQRHLESFSQINDFVRVITDLSMEGYPLTSNKQYFEMIAQRLESDLHYQRVSIRRVDNYISLFREINAMQLIGEFPVPSTVTTSDQLLVLVGRAFDELKRNNPLFERVPWLPIMQLEDFLLSRTSISPGRFWECLVDLRRRKLIELVQTKPALAAQAGLKVYTANGIGYSSIGLRGERL